MTSPRWVLDTNVVLSALLRPAGITGRLRLAWQARLFVPLVDPSTTSELLRVLSYPKFRLQPEEQHDLLADYLPWTEAIAKTKRPLPILACRDPNDLSFLHLAVRAEADLLVTGDQDLLSLSGTLPFPLCTPAQAIEVLSC